MVDFTELTAQSRDMEQKLSELLSRVEGSMEQQMPTAEEGFEVEPEEEEDVSPRKTSSVSNNSSSKPSRTARTPTSSSASWITWECTRSTRIVFSTCSRNPLEGNS